MKLQSTADGLRAVKVNNTSPHIVGENGNLERNPAWDYFEADNPEFDLTTPIPGNTVFEGVEVWQYLDEEYGWCTETTENAYKRFANIEEYAEHGKTYNTDTRQAYQPIEIQEQVREEAPNIKKLVEGFEPMDDDTLNDLTYSPEITAEQMALIEYPVLKDHQNALMRPLRVAERNAFIKGANWQSTKQQRRVSVEVGDFVVFEYYTETKCVVDRGIVIWINDTDCCVETGINKKKRHQMEVSALRRKLIDLHPLDASTKKPH